jgi:hypothetical protein
MYIKAVPGEPIETNFNPISLRDSGEILPRNLSDEFLKARYVFPVIPTERPANSPTSVISEGVPAQDEEGTWRQTWVETDRPLDEAKASLWEEVKRIRENKQDAPGSTAVTPFGIVQVDAKSKQNINGLVTMALLAQLSGAEFSEPFTFEDNSRSTLNAAQMIGLGVTVGKYVASVHSASTALRVLIDDAKNIEDLKAIDINNGWPA